MDERRRPDPDLREYLEAKIAHLSMLLDSQRAYSDRAIEKAEFALGKRLDGMNEFREALKDQTALMATREQLDILRAQVAEVDKRGTVTAAIVSLAISIMVSLIAWAILKP